MGSALMPAYRELHAGETGGLDQDASGRRRLKGRVLALSSRHDPVAEILAIGEVEQLRGEVHHVLGNDMDHEPLALHLAPYGQHAR